MERVAGSFGGVAQLLKSPVYIFAYKKQVEDGYAAMRTSSIVFCCLARDAQKRIPSFSRRLSSLLQCFSKTKVLIYENDSTDSTLDYLRYMERTFPTLEVISEKLNTRKFTSTGEGSRGEERISNLALARNKLLDLVKQNHQDFDYYAAVDVDTLDWDQDGIATTFQHDDWDMMGSQSLIQLGKVTYHYDTFAFRALNHPEPHHNAEIKRFLLMRGTLPHRVDSCFGGIGIYKMKSVIPFKYSSGDCEHVRLHRSMKEGGFDRIYMNPNMLVLHDRK